MDDEHVSAELLPGVPVTFDNTSESKAPLGLDGPG
jgi:hypothetical protein